MSKRKTKTDLEREIEALRKEVADLRAVITARLAAVPMPYPVPPEWWRSGTICRGITLTHPAIELPPDARIEIRN